MFRKIDCEVRVRVLLRLHTKIAWAEAGMSAVAPRTSEKDLFNRNLKGILKPRTEEQIGMLTYLTARERV